MTFSLGVGYQFHAWCHRINKSLNHALKATVDEKPQTLGQLIQNLQIQFGVCFVLVITLLAVIFVIFPLNVTPGSKCPRRGRLLTGSRTKQIKCFSLNLCGKTQGRKVLFCLYVCFLLLSDIVSFFVSSLQIFNL